MQLQIMHRNAIAAAAIKIGLRLRGWPGPFSLASFDFTLAVLGLVLVALGFVLAAFGFELGGLGFELEAFDFDGVGFCFAFVIGTLLRVERWISGRIGCRSCQSSGFLTWMQLAKRG
jgi:hypothetical protein